MLDDHVPYHFESLQDFLWIWLNIFGLLFKLTFFCTIDDFILIRVLFHCDMLQSMDSADEVSFDATQGLMERLAIEEIYEVSMVIPIRNLVNVVLREC